VLAKLANQCLLMPIFGYTNAELLVEDIPQHLLVYTLSAVRTYRICVAHLPHSVVSARNFGYFNLFFWWGGREVLDLIGPFTDE
jgi:hypothetical protein